MTPEGKVKAVVKRLLSSYGGDVDFFMPVQGGFGSRHLDFIGCAGGHYFTVETKAEMKEPTDIQKVKMREVRRAKGVTFVVADVTDKRLNDLRAFLDYAIMFPADTSPWLAQYITEPEEKGC